MERKRLLITDMDQDQIIERKDRYEGWTIVSDDGTIRPCLGCFTCWKKTPGVCVIKDGYNEMAKLLNEAEEIVYSSRFTYGGFSAFVKNVFDRSIGYVLPYFEVAEGEMHHQRRFSDIKKITFIFRGKDLGEQERLMARQYVEAVCRNMRNEVKEVLFEEEEAEEKKYETVEGPIPGKTILLNCSIRGAKANSEKFLRIVEEKLGSGQDHFRLAEHQHDPERLTEEVLKAEKIVLAMPLYVDGLPSSVIRFLEQLEDKGRGRKRKVYVLANLGLYESAQLRNLLSMIRYWCNKNEYEYCGAVCIGAGELIGTLIEHMKTGPVSTTMKALEVFSKDVASGIGMEDLGVKPFLFPRWLYILIANLSWDRQAIAGGMKPSDLRRSPE